MTLPQNVADALSRVQMMADSESEWADIDIADWQTIRAHLMSQEAEIGRLREAMEPKLRELHYDANGLRATLDGGACKALAESFAEQFNSSGAVNYLDVEFTTADGTSFVVTVQKRSKPTAHELRQLAESRLAAANALLRSSALFLQDMHIRPIGETCDASVQLLVRIQSHLQGAGDE